MRRIVYRAIIGASLLSACDIQQENDPQLAIQAGIASESYARKDGVDFSEYSLTWITELENGNMQIVDRSQTDPGIEKTRADLKGKKYWETCYGVSKEMVLGAMYCYYLEYDTFKLLATFRTK